MNDKRMYKETLLFIAAMVFVLVRPGSKKVIPLILLIVAVISLVSYHILLKKELINQ